MPIAFKIIGNICLYIFYTLFVAILFSFLFPLFFRLLEKNIPLYETSTYDKIFFAIALGVFFISTVFRKYFYFGWNQKKGGEVFSYTNTKKVEEKIKKEKSKEERVSKKQEEKASGGEDEIKIYIDKEIK